MDRVMMQKINNEVYRRFPEMKGTQPKIQPRQSAKTLPETGKPTFVFTYQTVTASPVPSLHRRVRVVVDEQGKILKISTSR